MNLERDHATKVDRALGALLGVAIGDAMGMPTQSMSRTDIASNYGLITDFCGAIASQPVSAGLRAATVTDDTEQSLLLAQLLIRLQGGFDDMEWARNLLAWERDTRARGVNDLLGPSTKRALDALMRGVSTNETGRYGTTNGAAMRIAPVGIATPAEPLVRLVDRVTETCRVTHNTSEAIGAAAAVAAVISLGIDGGTLEQGIELGLAAAEEGEKRGDMPAAVSITARMRWALDLSRQSQDLEDIALQLGTSVAAGESVPMAFAIARLSGNNAWNAAVTSANIGGDTDTIGAISAAMVGACTGAHELPPLKVAMVVATNGLELSSIVEGLLAIRANRAKVAEYAQ